MSAATATPMQELVSQIKKIEERLTPIDGLLKVLAEPASKAGMSPAEFLAKMTANGQGNFLVGGDGAALQAPSKKWHKGAQGIGMGGFLCDIFRAQSRGLGSVEAQQMMEEKHGSKWIDPTGTVTKAALAESSGITGGYTVPPMFSDKLMTLAIEESIVAPRAAHQPMTALTISIPYLDIVTAPGAGNSPFLGGVVATWVAEMQTRPESEPIFKMLELKANEISFYSVASNNLLADSAVALDSLLTQLFSAAIGFYTDYAYLRGDGVGKPLGILNAPATISVGRNAANQFKLVDAATMLSKLYGGSMRHSSLAWVVHQSVIPQLIQMNDAGNRPVWIPLNMGAREMPADTGHGGYSFGTLFGAPVLLTEKVPALGTKGDVMLIDFSKYIIGDRMELQIEVSPHVRFLQNSMVWRVVARTEGQPWLSGPITLADGAFTVSPFVVLN